MYRLTWAKEYGGIVIQRMVRWHGGYSIMRSTLTSRSQGRKRHMVLPFSKAVEGFMLNCRARGLSINTLMDYSRTIQKFQNYRTDDPPIDQLGSADIAGFLASCQVSNKSRRNYYIGLSSLWSWALTEKLVYRHVVREIKPPRPESRVVEPLNRSEVQELLKAVTRSRTYTISYSRPRDHALPHADRNRAILLLMLDTGVRASELCGLTVGDVNIKKGQVHVYGKGNKERIVPVSARTGQALWRYLSSRGETRLSDALFVTASGKPYDRRHLAGRMAELGKRAGVPGVHPHRFRHTFAINYLRNGGDIYTLQAILGHSTLEMVRRYLKLAQVDMDEAHRRASPVDNWRL